MKRALVLMALALSGCGNWSNDDPQYIGALPTKETLETQLKGTSGQMLSGAGTKQQPLFDSAPKNVGDHSPSYDSTVASANQFNQIIEFVVGIVGFIETVPPTKRTPDSRVWGPWPDDKHPGNEIRVTINKVHEGHFTYVFECHKGAADFTTVISGEADATSTVHHGTGSITLNFKAAQDNCAGDPSGADTATIDYDTSKFPTAVEVRAVGANDAGMAVVDYSESATDAGKLNFTYDPPTPINNGGVVEVSATSFWLSDGSGRQDGLVTKGTMTGVSGIECWDSSQAVTYQKWWDGTEHGDAGSCPAEPF